MMRSVIAVVVCLAASHLREAHAEVPALRANVEDHSLSLTGGAPFVSVAYTGRLWRVGASVRLPTSAVSAAAAYRAILAGDRSRTALFFQAGGGFSVLTLRPDLSVDVDVAFGFEWRRRWFIGALDLAIPASFRVTNGVQARVPMLLELWLGARVAMFSFGLQGAAGATLASGRVTAIAIALEGSVFVSLALP